MSSNLEGERTYEVTETKERQEKKRVLRAVTRTLSCGLCVCMCSVCVCLCVCLCVRMCMCLYVCLLTSKSFLVIMQYCNLHNGTCPNRPSITHFSLALFLCYLACSTSFISIVCVAHSPLPYSVCFLDLSSFLFFLPPADHFASFRVNKSHPSFSLKPCSHAISFTCRNRQQPKVKKGECTSPIPPHGHTGGTPENSKPEKTRFFLLSQRVWLNTGQKKKKKNWKNDPSTPSSLLSPLVFLSSIRFVLPFPLPSILLHLTHR